MGMFEASAGGLAEWAVSLAERQLAADVPQRWAHTQAVVDRARSLRRAVAPDGELLVAAAALHDIGFAPGVLRHGFCLLDAAEFAEELGGPPRLVALIANHAAGKVEGGLRGFGHQLERFPDEGGPVRDALWYCCLTVGADGQDVSLEERKAAWAIRYAGDPVISRYVEIAMPELSAAVARAGEIVAAARS
jgi:HD domain